MILPVYLYGQPVLRKVARDIPADYPGLSDLIQNMYQTMYESDGIGLAAPQIGLDIRLLVIDLDILADTYPEYKDYKLTMINAHILDISGEPVSREEGCLSLPGIHESVTRQEEAVKVTYRDAGFNEHTETFTGYAARVIQHEYDHLEGKMFIDHLSPIRKQLIKSRLNNIIKGKIRCDYRVKAIKK